MSAKTEQHSYLFPSKELRASSRDVVSRVPKTSCPRRKSLIGRIVKALSELRLYHQDLDGCRCWNQPEQLAAEERLTREVECSQGAPR
jgi:hypothetical protein